jgi:RimJ/RimL family protein N-acetyltransferase
MTIPTLETERLILRGPTLADFEASLAMWSDPIVVRYFGCPPFSEEEVWTRLLRKVGHWALLGFGYWIVTEKSTGRFVGEVGFGEGRREIEPRLVGIPEIGWCLASESHGQGLATEAVKTVLDWGDAHFGPISTACIIAPENAPSLRVAAKSGYTESCRTTYKGQPTIILRRDRTTDRPERA